MPTTTVTHRSVGPDDLDDVCNLIAACDLATVGFVDFTRDEIATDLAKATIESTGWYDEQGALVGYGWLERVERTNRVEIDLYLRPSFDPALGHTMVARIEQRAGELAAEAGHAEPWVGAAVYRQDTRAQDALRAAGFSKQTTFTRMRIDLDPARPPEQPRSDVIVRRITEEADLRVAHEVEEASFVEHYGNVPVSYESWLDRLLDRGEDFRQVYLAELDGTPVGLLTSTRQFEEDENAGYVRTLGVLPAARGRGVGTALLRDCFARAHREGRVAVLLHVDVANVTGALRVYESVGMRAVLEIDAWAKGERAD
jgi:ribosomal protein S18 acetylase RimI-like enzyme